VVGRTGPARAVGSCRGALEWDGATADGRRARLIIRVQAIIVGTGGHFLIRLRPQNEWDGQRDRGPEDGTIVKGL
jgi:hypothetical protein